MSRRVLVTGAASGLGAAFVEALRGRGDLVLATDARAEGGFETLAALAPQPPGSLVEEGDGGARLETSGGGGFETLAALAPQPPSGAALAPQPPSGAALAPQPPTQAVRLDVTSEDDWAAAAAWVEQSWGGLDLLVNNAGIAGGGRIDRCAPAEWERLIDVNLMGVVRGCRTFTPLMKRQRSGTIVNVASLAGLVHPAGMGSYNAVKAGVVALTETLGHELAAYGVTAHAVCPSYFRTDLMSSLEGADAAVGAVLRRLVEDSPVTAADIAAEALAAVDRGEELVLPDDAARAAYALKTRDRESYDALMRAQAAKLEERA